MMKKAINDHFGIVCGIKIISAKARYKLKQNRVV